MASTILNKTYAKGKRTYVNHKNKWSLWASKVKCIIAASVMTAKRSAAVEDRDNGSGQEEERLSKYYSRMEDLLGACWADQSIDLKSMDVVFCNGELEPRIVVNQTAEMVTMVKMVDSQDIENPVNHITYGHRPSSSKAWNENENGEMQAEMTVIASTEGRMPGATVFKDGGSKAGSTVRMVCDEEMETLPRSQICRAAGEVFEKRHHLTFNKPQIEDLHDGKQGKASSAFLRVYEHPMSTGRKVHISKKRSFRSGKPETTFGIYDTELLEKGMVSQPLLWTGLTWNPRWSYGDRKRHPWVDQREFWLEETDLPRKRKASSTGAYGWGSLWNR